MRESAVAGRERGEAVSAEVAHGAGPCARVSWAGKGEKEREEEGRLGWALGLVFSISYPFSISYFKPNSTYLNSNLNLNSTLAIKQIK